VPRLVYLGLADGRGGLILVRRRWRGRCTMRLRGWHTSTGC
jgi:hypothetical protein